MQIWSIICTSITSQPGKRISRPGPEVIKHFSCSTLQACHNFFVKKPKIFKIVKSERACSSQFSEKPDSARVNHNFKKFSDLRHKKYVCWNNHYNEHDTTLFVSDFNESEVN